MFASLRMFMALICASLTGSVPTSPLTRTRHMLEMVGNDQEMADMYFEMLFSEGTNVVSQLSLKYGSDNRVTAVQ